MATSETVNPQLEQPLTTNLRKQRAGLPKVRTGCSTCKQRRIKCDEQKPVCLQCQKSMRKCGFMHHIVPVSRRDGNFVPIRPRFGSAEWKAQIENLAAAIPALDPRRSQITRPVPQISVIHRNLPVSFLKDQTEHLYYDFFHHNALNGMCTYVDNPFWNRLILQECFHEPAVKHEVIALGAMYMAAQLGSSTDEASHREVALVQQSLALKLLRQRMSKPPFPLRLGLITSLLLANLETMHGNLDSALQQTNTGLKLMSIWEESKAKRNHNAAALQLPLTIEPEIFSLIPQLELQMTGFHFMNTWFSTHSDAEDAIDQNLILQTFNSIPERFESAHEAMPYAVRYSLRVISYVVKCNRVKARGPVIFSPWFTRELDALLKVHGRWHAAYQPIFKSPPPDNAKVEPLSSLLFRIYGRLYHIVLVTSTNLEETIFDEFNEQFKSIASLSRDVLQHDKILQGQRDSEGYQITIEMVVCLFILSTRCRERSTRLEAISILRELHSTNHLWGSGHLVVVAEWVFSIEEACRDESGFIPEDSRVRSHTIHWTANKGLLSLDCVQGSADYGNRQPRRHVVELPV